MNDEDVRPSQIQNVMKQNAYLLTYVLRGPVEKIPATVAEEVPAAEPTKMNIEKPLKEAATPEAQKKQKKEPTMRDLEEKEEEPKPKTPVALFNEKGKKKLEEGSAKVNGPMLIENEGENKAKVQAQAKAEAKEKARERAKSQPAEKKKESLNKIMPPPAQKPQEPAPVAQEKSISEKIFERLSQPTKISPANFSLNSILEDDLDAPVSKKRMEISQSLFKQPTKTEQQLVRASSLVKEKDSMVVEVTSKPASEKKIEIPVLKEEEKISYSKKLEALLDQKEARTYMVNIVSL